MSKADFIYHGGSWNDYARFHVPDRATYVQFIYLTISLSITRKGKQGRNLTKSWEKWVVFDKEVCDRTKDIKAGLIFW